MMQLKWIRGVAILSAGILTLAVPVGSAYANCTNVGFFVTHGLTNRFEGCGPDPSAFAWFHGRGVQRIIGPENTANQGNTTSGHDSANRSSCVNDGMCADAGAPGAYFGGGDFGNQGWDGCIANIPEGTSLCNGGPDYGPLDFAFGGIDPATPNVGRFAAVSVDFNQVLTSWVLDNAGAPSAGGDPCSGDALSGNPAPFTCSPISMPNITGSSPTSGGSIVTIGMPLQNVPVLDDCNVAETKAANCPRNFYTGRVLMFKRGACTAGTSATFDRRSYVFPASPAASNLTVPGNWTPLSNEDANLNGVLDAGEDGTNGGAVNGRLDLIIVPGQNAASTSARIPTIPGAGDCVYLATAIGMDNNGLSVNPPTNTIFGEMVLSTVVTVNPNPITANSATPVADLVTTIVASKTGGKGKVDWTTGVEMTISGFNVIGTKKGGGNEVKINGTLVAPKEGTTGKGASYTFEFDAGQLKGSSAVYIEVVKNNGSKARFGPASF